MTYNLLHTLELPGWLKFDLAEKLFHKNDVEKMNFVLECGMKNVENNSGGPFSAAIYNRDNNELISVGVNVVTSQNCSVAHAEVTAIMMAQQKLGTYSLENGNYELFSSAQPCAMCTGAIVWAGVRRLIFGANKKDVETIVGFDEGPLHPEWIEEYNKRNIEVVENFMNYEAVKLLKKYKEIGGIVY